MKRSELIKIIKEEISNVISEQDKLDIVKKHELKSSFKETYIKQVNTLLKKKNLKDPFTGESMQFPDTFAGTGNTEKFLDHLAIAFVTAPEASGDVKSIMGFPDETPRFVPPILKDLVDHLAKQKPASLTLSDENFKVLMKKHSRGEIRKLLGFKDTSLPQNRVVKQGEMDRYLEEIFSEAAFRVPDYEVFLTTAADPASPGHDRVQNYFRVRLIKNKKVPVGSVQLNSARYKIVNMAKQKLKK